MARGIRWQIPFVDLYERRFAVNIYDEDYSGAVTVLKGGVDPIVTEEDGDSDPFAPVRAQSGYITFVDEDGTMAEAVKADGRLDRYVELVMVGDGSAELGAAGAGGTWGNGAGSSAELSAELGAVMWCGYIVPEEYSGTWGPAPVEVRMPVVSVLGVLKHQRFWTTGRTRKIGDIVLQALDSAHVDMVAITHSNNVGANCFNAQVCDLAFTLPKPTEGGDLHRGVDADMESPEEIYSCYEVLEEVCKYFGWSCHERGNELWMTASDATMGWEKHLVSDMRAGRYSATTGGTAKTVDLPMVTGADNERSVASPKSQVRITVATPQMDEDILGETSIDDMQYLRSVNTDIYSAQNATWCADLMEYDDCVKAYQYAASGGNAGARKQDMQMVATNINAHSLQDMVTLGGFVGYDCYVYNYDLSDIDEKRPSVVVSCNYYDDYAHKFYGEEAVEISTRDVLNLGSGNYYMLLEFDAVLITYANGEKRLGGPDKEEAKKGNLIARLEYRRTDGTSLWYSNRDSEGHIVTNGVWLPTVEDFWLEKNARTMENFLRYGNVDGITVTLPTGVGRLVLHLPTQQPDVTVYDPDAEVLLNGLKYVRFEGLKMTLKPYRSTAERNHRYDTTEVRYNRKMNDVNKEVYQRQCVLLYSQAAPDLGFSYGLVSGSADTYTPQLDRMAAWYGKRQTTVRVKVAAPNSANSANSAIAAVDRMRVGQDLYVIGSEKHLWRDGDVELKLLKI